MAYSIRIRHPLIKSILDTLDLYKMTMGSVAFHDFPHARVTYAFINRGKTPFPERFADELRNQIEMLADLTLSRSEFQWLNTIRFLRPTFIEWFNGYHFHPSEVTVVQNSGELKVNINGPWYRTIFWEVGVMALISELYFTLRGVKKAPDWIERIHGKGKLLSENGCHFIDFSTRRRFSGEVQDMVVSVLKNYAGFLGTSNPYLAYKHGVPPSGTFAHEYVQFMAAYYSPRLANPKATEHWSRHYAGDLGIALTDTFTTDVFLRDFDMFQAKLYDGVRHDSEDPYAWGDKMLAHYKRLGILTGNKRFVFSDALKIGPPDQKMIGNAYNYIPLDLKFRQFAQPVGGIGTFFSNDICTIEDQANGIKPLNIVIKLATVDYGRGPIPVVKLSDEPGKHTGDPEAIAQVKRELGIA